MNKNKLNMDENDLPIKNNQSESCDPLLSKKVSRRSILKSIGKTSVLIALATLNPIPISARRKKNKEQSTLKFEEVSQDITPQLKVSKNNEWEVFLRWGDPIFKNAPAFNPFKQTKDSQLKQVGYNNDFVGLLPQTMDHLLMAINHEYTIPKLMFPKAPSNKQLTNKQLEIEMVAHGLTLIQIKKENNRWNLIQDAAYNQKITPETPMMFSGPAAGDFRLKTKYSTDSVRTFGTWANGSGSVTPWGTILTAEKNIQQYFMGSPEKTQEWKNYKRFGFDPKLSPQYYWGKINDHWDLDKNPNAAMHGGWIVEIDPRNKSIAKKRTALGRFRHGSCTLVKSHDNRIVIYMSDAQHFEYIYKFVSKEPFNPSYPDKNILDKGTLYVARLTSSDEIEWRPLKLGYRALNKRKGFYSQADIMLDTRRASDLVDATPMDNPEGITHDPHTGDIFVMLPENKFRILTNKPNPRSFNKEGHIIKLSVEDHNHTNRYGTWEMFLLAGHKNKQETTYHPDTSEKGWFANPDNGMIDKKGHLWITTNDTENFDIANGIWACDTKGSGKGLTKRFLKVPIGAEACSPVLTPDNETMFCAIQHPGEGSDFNNPSTRWPDFNPKTPPRPGIVAINMNKNGS